MTDFNCFYSEKSVFTSFTLLDEKRLLDVLSWRNSDSVRKEMVNTSLISEKEHFEFVRKLKDDKENIYWLVTALNGAALGVFYLNNIDFKNVSAELGIYVVPDGNIKGAGSFIMDSALELYSEMGLKKIFLKVFKNNERAFNFYVKNGFCVADKVVGEMEFFTMRLFLS